MTATPLRWMLSAAVLAGLALVATVLFLFDPSTHAFYPGCLFYKLTGLLCPGCGSLRALHQLLHGHFSAAFRFNPLLMLCLPVGLWLAGVHCYRAFQNQPARTIQAFSSAKWIWLFVGITLAFTIWRNLPGSALAMLPP
jgi:hypothetical protein